MFICVEFIRVCTGRVVRWGRGRNGVEIVYFVMGFWVSLRVSLGRE